MLNCSPMWRFRLKIRGIYKMWERRVLYFSLSRLVLLFNTNVRICSYRIKLQQRTNFCPKERDRKLFTICQNFYFFFFFFCNILYVMFICITLPFNRFVNSRDKISSFKQVLLLTLIKSVSFIFFLVVTCAKIRFLTLA